MEAASVQPEDLFTPILTLSTRPGRAPEVSWGAALSSPSDTLSWEVPWPAYYIPADLTVLLLLLLSLPLHCCLSLEKAVQRCTWVATITQC